MSAGLQRFLAEMKLIDARGIDGILGPRTTTAVKDFQQGDGLVADGVAGDLTWFSPAGAAGATLASRRTSRPSDLGRSTAIELKYLTATLRIVAGSETYDLLNQGAQDIRCYDVVKDLRRVEEFVADGVATDGLVLVLSNDRSYWTDPAHGRPTGAAAFRIYEGVVLQGPRDWGTQSGPGTRRKRETAIPLAGSYPLTWQDYAALDTKNGTVRVLAIHVPSTGNTVDPVTP